MNLLGGGYRSDAGIDAWRAFRTGSWGVHARCTNACQNAPAGSFALRSVANDTGLAPTFYRIFRAAQITSPHAATILLNTADCFFLIF